MAQNDDQLLQSIRPPTPEELGAINTSINNHIKLLEAYTYYLIGKKIIEIERVDVQSIVAMFLREDPFANAIANKIRKEQNL